MSYEEQPENRSSIKNINQAPDASNNANHVEENDINLNIPFGYFDTEVSAFPFSLEGQEITEIFQNNKGQYYYIISILLRDDSVESSSELEKTLRGIINNLQSLSDLGINSQNILICIFLKEIKTAVLVKKEHLSLISDNKQQFLYLSPKKNNFSELNICIISKNTIFYENQALKCFYCGIITQLRNRDQTIFTSVITSNVVPALNSLKKLICSSYDSQKYHAVSVGLIETNSNSNGLVSKINQYERVHFNLYDMNFYDMAAAVPVSSLISTMCLDENLYNLLKIYYLRVNENQTIDFHDCYLALYLYQSNIKIKFLSKETYAYLTTNELSYADYQNIWVSRYSGYYGNFFDIIKTFLNFNYCNPLKKIFLFFQILGLAIDFIFPSLASMVIYSTLYEAFGATDKRPAIFFTILYIVLLTASGASSLISKNAKKTKLTNYFLYIFMEAYYLFVILCSVAAMDRVHKNKDHNSYKFNKAAASLLIILTFLPYIVPMIIKNGVIITNILPMLLYLLLGASCSTSNFLIAKLWNAAETSGGEEIYDRKSLTVIVFFLFNLFFGCLTFYNNTRKKRVVCVMGLSIMFLIYNFARILAIVLRILGDKDNTATDNIVENDVKIMFCGGEGMKNDMRSEQEQLKGKEFRNDGIDVQTAQPYNNSDQE